MLDTSAEAVLAGIGERFGWSAAYVAHLAQPYCDCGYDGDGEWYYCSHASDLGFNSITQAGPGSTS